jgi:hypothetical protein
MPTIEIQVRRFSVVSSRSFEEIVRRLTATIGHPDMNAFHSALTAAGTVANLEEVVQGAIGCSDLMEFAGLASLIAPYGSQAALAVAKDLDAKIESLLETAAWQRTDPDLDKRTLACSGTDYRFP